MGDFIKYVFLTERTTIAKAYNLVILSFLILELVASTTSRFRKQQEEAHIIRELFKRSDSWRED